MQPAPGSEVLNLKPHSEDDTVVLMVHSGTITVTTGGKRAAAPRCITRPESRAG